MPEYRIHSPSDELLAEIIITLRKGFGMDPASYSRQTGIITIPDEGEPEPEEEKPEEPKPEPEETKKKPGPKPKDKE